jgi:hypothetical protein
MVLVDAEKISLDVCLVYYIYIDKSKYVCSSPKIDIAEMTRKFTMHFYVIAAKSVFEDLVFGDEHYILNGW